MSKGANEKGRFVMAREKSEGKPGKKSKLLRWLVLLGAAVGIVVAVAKRKKPAPRVSASPSDRLVVKDEENISGLGFIMSSLFGEFLKNPKKVALLDTINLSVAIEPLGNPETAITMAFSNGSIVLEPGVVNPDIKIVCDYEVLMQLAQMPAGPAVIKFLQTPEGKNILNKLKSRELKLKGVVTHPVGMLKFSMFLAPGA